VSDGLKLALIGAGQLGASFALAIRASGAAMHITAYDSVAAHTQQLHERGGVDAIAASPADAVAGADIVMLATPVRSYRALAQAIAPVLKPHAIVTDLGSVKGSMTALAGVLAPTRLVPGHPIAGSEKSGPAIARADLFTGKLCILTPANETSPEAVDAVAQLWHLAGADVLNMPVEVHDAIYAHVSHLPHYIAFIAAETMAGYGVYADADDAVLQRFLRISRSNPRMWTDIALENREALLPALATYTALLEHFVSELRSGDAAKTELTAGDAATRYMPRILASSLISAVSLYEQRSDMDLRPFGAGGMRDIVAPAATAPEADMEAISHAAAVVASVIETSIGHLRALEVMIGAEDEAALLAAITGMVAHAKALVTPRQ
jgi:prephenate dehydrogenase